MGWSEHQKMGLTHHQPAHSFKGYTLLAPLQGDSGYLLDLDGRVVHRWQIPGFALFQVRLLPNRNLLVLCTDRSVPAPARPPFDQPPPPFDDRVRILGGGATHLKELNWDGQTAWEYANQAIHHDFARLVNGNTIVAEWVELPAGLARQVRGGAHRPREKFPPLISDDLVEIDQGGHEVARIHLWEQLDPVRDPICPLEARWEWTHLNSLDLMSDGALLFSCRNNSRVGILERPGGQLRWKIGPPHVFHQHHATSVGRGNVQVFDNGMHRIGNPFSRVVELNPENGSEEWEYVAESPEQFFSGHISGAERLPNGNVLVCEGTSGRLFEITRRGETVWEWVSPFMNQIQGYRRPWLFRAYRYGPDHPALAGRDLSSNSLEGFNRLHGL